MRVRKIRTRGLKLQKGAIPFRHWLRQHEWGRHASALRSGVIGSYDAIRIVRG